MHIDSLHERKLQNMACSRLLAVHFFLHIIIRFTSKFQAGTFDYCGVHRVRFFATNQMQLFLIHCLLFRIIAAEVLRSNEHDALMRVLSDAGACDRC